MYVFWSNLIIIRFLIYRSQYATSSCLFVLFISATKAGATSRASWGPRNEHLVQMFYIIQTYILCIWQDWTRSPNEQGPGYWSRWNGNNQEPAQSNCTSLPWHQTIQTIKTAKRKPALAESQEDSSFPTEGHRSILNKMNKKSKENKADEH